MSSRIAKPHIVVYTVPNPVRGTAARATWSRPISSRADRKLAPCMARPNLFSGD